MSGEFGSYNSGYFWWQMENAAEDCLGGSDELTRLWGEFLRVFTPVAKSIAWSEAGDSGSDHPIIECIAAMPELRRKLDDIDKYLQPFKAVAERAVREKVKQDTEALS